MADIKIDQKKLDKYSELIEELLNTINTIGLLYNSLSDQERLLVGGFIVEIKSFWKDQNYSFMSGEGDTVAGLVNRTVKAVQQYLAPKQKSVFGKNGDGSLPN